MAGGTDNQIVLWVDIKSPTPATRLLSLEVFAQNQGSLDPLYVLVIPEDLTQGLAPGKVEKFFVPLQNCVGYKFIDQDLYSHSPEWRKVESILAKTQILDLNVMLRLYFPTLTARSLEEYAAAFELEPQLPNPVKLAKLIDILIQRAHELPGGTQRALKTVFRGLSREYSEWLGNLPRIPPDSHYEIDPLFLNTLDRFENLTGGRDLVADEVVPLFSESGKMAEYLPGYELRKGQAKYAQAVLKAITQQANLILEAATGTGKSLGYLLPIIASCSQKETRAVIVTRTKSLQEQLFRSDLRKIRSLIPDGFRISLLKGLANYLCLLKYKLFLSDLSEFMGRIPAELMAALIIWENFTDSGDLTETAIFDQENSEDLRARVTLEEGSCLGKQCQFYNDCYAFRARKNATRSEIVITNYALLFSDLVAGADILGHFSYAVFDEAHRLENEAINAFSESIPLQSFARSIEKLTDDTNFPTLKAAIEASDNPEALIGFESLTSRLFTATSFATDEVRKSVQRPVRSQQDRVRFRSNDPMHKALCALWERESVHLIQLRDTLSLLHQSLSGKTDEDRLEGVTQLRRLISTLIKHLAVLEKLTSVDDSNDVMWLLMMPSGEIWITIAPLNVGNHLSKRLYNRFDSKLFTSATLDSEDNFEWTSSRLGLVAENGASTFSYKIRSPFPLDKQLRVALARYLPPPNVPEYSPRLGQLILKLRTSARLPTLVLCTSYRMVEEIAKPLLANQSQAGEVLYQTPDTLPQTLLARFRLARNAILIGTESFWEGIDLPDELLRLLFITRLPFAVPDDPLELARQEQAESRGENPFMTVSLPQAILKYRQGIGRMIRSSTDWGAVIVTDSRMGRKNYGRLFVSASPVEVNVHDNESMLVNETAKWLAGKKTV